MILHRFTHRGSVAFPNEITVDFDSLPRILAISGPNGAGKTTLLDAIIGALYLTFPFRPGPLHRNFNSGKGFIDLVWSPAPAGPRYRSRVNVDPEAERVEASLFPADGGPAIAGPLQRGYLKKIEEILGPLDVLLASAVSVQQSLSSKKSTYGFLLAERAERRAILAELLRLNAFGMREAGCKDKIRGLETQLTGLRVQVTQLEQEMTKHPAAVLAVAANTERVGTAREALKGAQTAHVEAQERLQDAKTQVAALAPYRAQEATLRAEVEALNKRLTLVRTALTDATAQITTSEAAQWAPARREKLIAEIAALESIRPQFEQLQREFTAIEDQLEEAIEQSKADATLLAREAEIRGAATAAVELTAQIEVADREVERQIEADSEALVAYKDWLAVKGDAGRKRKIVDQLRQAVEIMDSVPCKGEERFQGCRFLTNAATASAEIPAAEAEADRLERLVGEEREAPVAGAQSMRDSRDALRQRLQTVKTLADMAPALDQATARAAALDDRINTLNAKRDDSRVLRTELAEKLREVPTLQAELEQIAPAVRQAAMLGAVRAVATEAETRIKQTTADVTAKTEQLAECTIKVAGAGRAEEELRSAERAVLEGARAAREAQAAVTAAERDLTTAQAKLSALEETAVKVADLKAAIGPVSRDLDDWSLIAKSFGPAGIPALLVDQALPEIAATATEMLSECLGQTVFTIVMTTQRESADQKKMLETLEVKVLRNGEEMDAADLSGGEGVLASEALSLSIARFNASRPGGKRAYTLFRDEVGANLDEQAAPAYTRLLARAAKIGGFDKVLFVSHHEAALELADARLNVRGSKVTVS